MNARQALDQVAEAISPARGHIRVAAYFTDGRYSRSELSIFRLPPGAIAPLTRRTPENISRRRELLEHVAAELQLDAGECFLIAEYDTCDGQPRLKWVDFGWSES